MDHSMASGKRAAEAVLAGSEGPAGST
jgi:hypothetical protein